MYGQGHLLLAQLFGEDPRTWTRDQFMVDNQLQAIIETARGDGETNWSDIEEQVVNLADQYPRTVDRNSIGEVVDLTEGDDTTASEGSPETSSLQNGQHQQTKADAIKGQKRIYVLRLHVKTSNMAMLEDVSPKPYQGKVTHRGEGGPQGAIIDRLLDMIGIQGNLYDASQELQVPVISDGMKADLAKFKAIKIWNEARDKEYKETLDRWQKLVADATECRDKRLEK